MILSTLATVEILAKVCDEKKATDIRIYDVMEFSPFVDYVIFCSVKNNIHLSSLAQEIVTEYKRNLADKVSDDFYPFPHVSGASASGWIAVDCNACVFHIMSEEMRDLYGLDAIYSKRGTSFYF
jgi:ribosome-associated protein